MDRAALIIQFRSDADDQAEPPLSGDDLVTTWLNEAEDEAAVRADLLLETEDDDICQIDVEAGTARYALHEAVACITRATFTRTGSSDVKELTLTTRTAMDRDFPGWRTRAQDPCHLIQDDTSVTLGSLPDADGVLRFECQRTPLTPMADDGDTPEIHRLHHRHLVNWALYRHYSRPDTEQYDPGRAQKALDVFTGHFGLPRDAQLARDREAEQAHHNVADW